MQIARLKDCVIYSIHLLPLLLSLALFCPTILLCILLGEANLIFMYSWYKKKKVCSFMYSKFYVSRG